VPAGTHRPVGAPQNERPRGHRGFHRAPAESRRFPTATRG
jgi:hypothetical protein